MGSGAVVVQLAGGPESICGQGGRMRVLEVLLPSLPVTVTVAGGRSMLGSKVITAGVWFRLT